MSMITATTWVPRGFAAAFPTKYVFDDDEYERISKLAKLELDDAKEGLAEAQAELNGDGKTGDDNVKKATSAARQAGSSGSGAEKEDEDIDLNDDDLKEYDLEHYDSDDEEAGENPENVESSMSMFGNVRSLAYHQSNAEDPYITLNEGEASDDEDREELQIMPTDNLVLAARIEDEVAHLECYVYDDQDDNLYVHHDIMLPAIPLAVEWLDMPVNKKGTTAESKGNYVAVGTMDPDIEIWDLDTIDSMYPAAILGQGTAESSAAAALSTQKKKKKKAKNAEKINANYHTDAVLSLSANRAHRNLLASASADTTVKLWDLTTCTAAKSYQYHSDKVCSLHFHPNPSHATILLSGSYDRTVCAADLRLSEMDKIPRWGVDSDVENVRWDPFDEHKFYTSTESGILYCFDARNAPSDPAGTKPLWRLQAHESSLSSFSINPSLPGFIATGGTDRTVKLWNVQQDSASGPSMVVSRDLGVGRVFSAQFAPDESVAFRLAVAGSKGNVQVWDTSTNRAVREAFGGRAPGVKPASASDDVVERLVGVAADDEDDSDEEEEEEEEEDAAPGADERGWESMSE
ncbi:hypothetical protein AAFC00_007260 [Neodothiora populina]|uniref:WD40 repeat-like protein n=1 Tax=Neodothiora populina TaxID=2781224 RepID=A0ABR3PHQ0_9PEZI